MPKRKRGKGEEERGEGKGRGVIQSVCRHTVGISEKVISVACFGAVLFVALMNIYIDTKTCIETGKSVSASERSSLVSLRTFTVYYSRL